MKRLGEAAALASSVAAISVSVGAGPVTSARRVGRGVVSGDGAGGSLEPAWLTPVYAALIAAAAGAALTFRLTRAPGKTTTPLSVASGADGSAPAPSAARGVSAASRAALARSSDSFPPRD